MTDRSRASTPASNAIAAPLQWSISLMSCVPYWFVALITRISIAGVFWQSGRTKVDGWRLSEFAIELFRSEYKLPVIDPTIAAYLAAFAEHFHHFFTSDREGQLAALARIASELNINLSASGIERFGDGLPTVISLFLDPVDADKMFSLIEQINSDAKSLALSMDPNRTTIGN